ncbi:uncharacterized protein TNCV_4440611 [Trichonephila clavipes]|nr:uncharacterized protein TNCV_4440611 [Trichonephila clavipes]
MPKARSKVSRKRKFYGNRFTKLALNSNNTSASEAKLSSFDSFDVPKPEFHECYATGLKLADDSKEGLCSNLCVACCCGFMTGFTSTPEENKKFSLNTLLVFGLRLIDRGFTADLEVMTQYCKMCELNVKCEHVCSNYKGSSGNMEVVGAFRIFERSLIK